MEGYKSYQQRRIKEEPKQATNSDAKIVTTSKCASIYGQGLSVNMVSGVVRMLCQLNILRFLPTTKLFSSHKAFAVRRHYGSLSPKLPKALTLHCFVHTHPFICDLTYCAPKTHRCQNLLLWESFYQLYLRWTYNLEGY